MPPRDWDAGAYDALSDAQFAMGRDVIARLGLREDERVLDAGCGTGRLTELLVAAVPAGRVLAVDGSPAMVAAARERLGDRADVARGDLAELTTPQPVDAIFSNATLHWISDHDRLFARLFGALRPGGRLCAQFGAEGNITDVREAIAAAARRPPFSSALAGWPGPWTFHGADATAARARRIGFADVWAWRTWVRVEPERPQEYFATVVLGAHLDRLAPEHRAAFTAAVLDRLGRPVAVDYARLNLLARRPAG